MKPRMVRWTYLLSSNARDRTANGASIRWARRLTRLTAARGSVLSADGNGEAEVPSLDQAQMRSATVWNCRITPKLPAQSASIARLSGEEVTVRRAWCVFTEQPDNAM